jgi:ubiquitin carboxyl-terminal hydrolase 10
LTVHAPNQPDIVTVEDWRLLQLNIQVRCSFSFAHNSLRLTFKIIAQPESVHAVEDALAYISRPQPVQISQSGSSEASQQVHLEALPPILVLRLERFLYNAAADGIVKIRKPIQFAPELEIPLGRILSFVSPRVSQG